MRALPRAPVAVAVLCLAAGGAAAAQERIAFVGINVVPMGQDTVWPGQTVLVDSGRIVAIAPARRGTEPAGARRIDGTGKFLLPGLADMHVHFMRDSTELALLIAHGVTTARELAGEPVYLSWRQEIESGQRLGPQLYVTSPFIDGVAGRKRVAWRVACTAAVAGGLLVGLGLVRRLVRGRQPDPTAIVAGAGIAIVLGYVLATTVIAFPDRLLGGGRVPRFWVASSREAARTVREAARSYDQIKLYSALSAAEFAAAVGAAREAGKHTIAHVPTSMSLSDALGSGLDELAHVYFVARDLQQRTDTSGARGPEERQEAYAARLRAMVGEIRRSGVWVTTTLAPLPEVYRRFTDSAAFYAQNDMQYRPPHAREFIRSQIAWGPPPGQLEDLRWHILWGSRALAELARAGVPLVLGTDASPRDIVSGLAVHTELEQLTAAGLSRYAALRTATVAASEVAGARGQWGTVTVGARADLLVLDKDPRRDLGTLRRPVGVMARGRWLDRRALDSLLADVIAQRAGRAPQARGALRRRRATAARPSTASAASPS